MSKVKCREAGLHGVRLTKISIRVSNDTDHILLMNQGSGLNPTNGPLLL